MDEELRPGVKHRLQYSSFFQPMTPSSKDNSDSTEATEQILCSLKITNCQFSDCGEYTCHAQNSYGSNSILIYLDVI